MRSRALFVVLVIAVAAQFFVPTNAQSQESPPPGDPAASPPALPTGITLADLVSRQKVNCSFIGKKLIKHSTGAPYTAPVSEAMPVLLALTPTSYDARAAAPTASPRTKSMCAFLKKAKCPDDLVEAMLRANCREKLYKNCDIIDEAAKKCAPECVARWRTQYPDNP